LSLTLHLGTRILLFDDCLVVVGRVVIVDTVGQHCALTHLTRSSSTRHRDISSQSALLPNLLLTDHVEYDVPCMYVRVCVYVVCRMLGSGS
jgi:hypothetical protein